MVDGFSLSGDLMGNDSLSFFWVLENYTFFQCDISKAMPKNSKSNTPNLGIFKSLETVCWAIILSQMAPCHNSIPAICQTLGDMSASSPDVEFMCRYLEIVCAHPIYLILLNIVV